MNERDVTALLRESLERVEGAWFYKIPDDARPSDDGVRRIIGRPCDIIGCYQGRMVAIEAKMIKEMPQGMGNRAFEYEMLTTSQKKHLPRMHRAGCETFIACIVASSNRLWMIPWSVFWTRRIFTRFDIEKMPFLQGAKSGYPVQEWLEMGMPDLRAFCPCGRMRMHEETCSFQSQDTTS